MEFTTLRPGRVGEAQTVVVPENTAQSTWGAASWSPSPHQPWSL